jgi:predicted transcriptional regulator
MLKKLQLYNETEAVLKETRNKLILGFMKVAIENRMMITQIKNGLDLQVRDLTKRIEQLEEKERQDREQKDGSS